MAGGMPQEWLVGKSFLPLSEFFFRCAFAQRGLLGWEELGGGEEGDPNGLHARPVQWLPSRTPSGPGQGDSL